MKLHFLVLPKLKVFTVSAETTESGKLFQVKIILFVKENLRVSNCIGDWLWLLVLTNNAQVKHKKHKILNLKTKTLV